MKTKLTLIMFLIFPLLTFSQNQAPETAAEVIDLIKKNIEVPWAAQTVDTFKAGNPSSEVSGIAVCMFADMKTLKRAVNSGCNLIITHEPVFFNHLDETKSYSEDPVFREKVKFIKEKNLVIFRLHDHVHKTKPDIISAGMVKKMKLEKYSLNEKLTLFRIPKTSLKNFAERLKIDMDLKNIRLIGNPEMQFEKLAFMAGAPGGQGHIQMLANEEVEVLIAGEAPEWETYLYANDAVSLEKNKAVIFLGHIKSEEAGMEYCAEWLRGFIRNIPIIFIENPANYTTY